MLDGHCSREIRANGPAPGSPYGARRPLRIIFVNRYFFPDCSATSQVLSDLAFHLGDCGNDVHVVTSQQRYDDPRARLAGSETIGGVRIHRVATSRFGRSALLGRGFDYLSFCNSSTHCILSSAMPGDILVVKTDPPLLCLPLMQVARRRGLRVINWLQDLYPEIAARLGVPLTGGALGGWLLHLRDAAMRAAAANVVVGERMAATVRSRGIAAARVHVIPNWCDDDEIRPVAHHDNPLRCKWELDGRFVVGYSGNLGLAHEFDTVLAAAEYLCNQPRFVFLCIGGGNNLAELARRVRKRKLEHLFRFLPYQDRVMLKYSLSVADVHWISLKPELEGLMAPSKVYGIAAAGRAILAITAEDGELADLIQRNRCGIVFRTGDGRALADALISLDADKARVDEMGYRARMMLDKHFTRRRSFERWRTLLEAVASTPLQSGSGIS
jgi:glycosyltransferase involved in cell wall biosynthesis